MSYIFVYLKRVNSTNDVIAELIERGVDLPIVVVAEEQKRGKGRYGRKWYSPKGGLWFSIGDKIEGDKRVFTVYLPLAVIETLEVVSGVKFSIRIPNDVVVEDKKISGILVEEKGEATISGIGININIREFPEEIKKTATSLFLLKNREYNLDEILDIFIANYDRLKKEFFEKERDLFNKWKKKLSTIGRNVKITLKEGEIEGRLMDVSDSFNLVITRGDELSEFSIWGILKLEEI